MRQSQREIKEKILQDYNSGLWFPKNRSAGWVRFENIGRGLALVLRVIYRGKIGHMTFNWPMVFFGFTAIVLTCLLSLSHWGAFEYFGSDIFSTIKAIPVHIYVLGIYGLIFLIACLNYRYNPSDNVLTRGESVIFSFLKDKDSDDELTIQRFIEPLTVLLIGLLIWFKTPSSFFGAFLITCAICQWYDEWCYYHGKVGLDKLTQGSGKEGEKVMKVQEKLNKEDEDSIYD